MRIVRYYPDTTSFAPAYGLSARNLWAGLETEVDRLFTGGADFPVAVQQDKDNTYVRAELPGVKREDIKVETADGTLTIAAARKEKNGETENAVTLSRSISLPGDVQADQVSAVYENGVLTVTLPKAEALKPRQVEVK
jgi:HSP20 family protein